MQIEHSQETRDFGWSLIDANNGEIKWTLRNVRSLFALAEGPEQVKRWGDVLLFLFDLREQQLQAGTLIRRARAHRAKRRS